MEIYNKWALRPWVAHLRITVTGILRWATRGQCLSGQGKALSRKISSYDRVFAGPAGHNIQNFNGSNSDGSFTWAG